MRQQKKNVLILGGSGFLGSSLINEMLQHRNYNIFCFYRKFNNFKRFNLKDNKYKKIIFINDNNLENYFSKVKFDVICNCAVNYGRNGILDTKKVLDPNIYFPIKILELAIKYKSKCFLNTDSYFSKNNMTYKSLLNYSLSKQALRLWLNSYSDKIKVINIILEHLYGDPYINDKFLEKCIYDISIGKVNSIDLTLGKQKRDFLYIDDAVKAYIKIINHISLKNFTYKDIGLGTGKMHQLSTFIKKIKLISNSETILNFGAIDYRKDEIFSSYANIKELKKLNISFQNDIYMGISKTLKKMSILYE